MLAELYKARPDIAMSVIDRFYERVDRSGDCWVWTGRVLANGYGVLPIFDATRRRRGSPDRLAHRIAYELAFDVDPGELFVCHKCDNPACVRPSHLFLGTNKDNVADCRRKDRDIQGERSRIAKVTDDKVRVMREEFKAGTTQTALANRFGVSISLVNGIVHGRRWRHVA